MKASVSAVLYTSKVLANGEHPIMLRVSYNGKREYKSLKLSCSTKDWNKDKSEVRSKHPYCYNINSIINHELSKLKELVLEYERTGKPYSAKTLIEKLSKPLPSRKTLLELIDERVQYFKYEKGKYNTSTGYKTLYNLIKRFSPNRDIELFEIDKVWLRDFENYLKITNKKETSIYKHFCCLKATINLAIANKYLSDNPFDGFEQKLDRRTKKRALTVDGIDKLLNYFLNKYYCTYTNDDFQSMFYNDGIEIYDGKALRHNCKPDIDLEDIEEEKDEKVRKFWNEYFKKEGYNKLHPQLNSEAIALSLFLCSYIMQGLALVDLANLKWKDLHLLSVLDEDKYIRDVKQHNEEYANNNKIYKYYYKTELLRNKTKHPTKIIVDLADFNAFACLFIPSKETYNPDNYIFGIFDNAKNDASTKFGRMTYMTYLVNHNLKKAAQKAGVSSDITFYTARHTYASQLYHNGVPISLIAQNMGREISNIETYLKEFDNNRIIESNRSIFYFKTPKYDKIETEDDLK